MLCRSETYKAAIIQVLTTEAQLKKAKGPSIFLVTLEGMGSRYCLLKTLHHTSNHVYFKVFYKVNAAFIDFQCYNLECKSYLKQQSLHQKALPPHLHYVLDSVTTKAIFPGYTSNLQIAWNMNSNSTITQPQQELSRSLMENTSSALSDVPIEAPVPMWGHRNK